MDDDFYGEYKEVDEKKPEKTKKNKKKKAEDFSYEDNGSYDNENGDGTNKVLLIVLGILLIVLAVLLIIKFYPKIKDKINDDPVTFTTTKYTIYIGQSTLISYKSDYTLNWSTNDSSICTIENNKVTAVSTGECIVKAAGVDNEGNSFEKFVYVTINNPSSTPQDPSGELSLDLKSNGSNGWNNDDVKINVTASGYTRLVYVINCSGTCDYKNVSNNAINVTSEGENKVTVVASKGDKEVKKDITVKIDKSKPTCSLKANESTITATVNDSISGVDKKGFNKDYSDNSTTKSVSSVGTYTYYVKDNAGNTNTCTINVSGSTQYRTASCVRGKSCKDAGCSEYDETKWTDATDTDGICSGRTSDVTSGDIRCTNCSSGSCKFQTTVCKTYKKSIDKCGCDEWGQFGEWTTEAATGSNYLKVETRVVIK